MNIISGYTYAPTFGTGNIISHNLTVQSESQSRRIMVIINTPSHY